MGFKSDLSLKQSKVGSHLVTHDYAEQELLKAEKTDFYVFGNQLSTLISEFTELKQLKKKFVDQLNTSVFNFFCIITGSLENIEINLGSLQQEELMEIASRLCTNFAIFSPEVKCKDILAIATIFAYFLEIFFQMLDYDNDSSISYQDFTMFLATSGTHYARSTNMMFNVSEKEKNHRYLDWEQVDIQSRNTFSSILEHSLRLARKLRLLQEDFPIEVCKLKEHMHHYINQEEECRERFVNRFDTSGWAGTRIGMYEFDAIRRAFWKEGVRIGSLGGVEEYTLRLLLR